MNAEITTRNAKRETRDWKTGKVAVLMGGLSAEREVSLKSGAAVLEALRRRGVDAHEIDAGRDVLKQLDGKGFDRVFIALHGRWGEDGVIQGALDVLGLPYTGSGVLGSALAMDKLRSKQLWSAADIPTPGYALLEVDASLESVVVRVGLPLMVKPNREGSSLGMSKVNSVAELARARDVAANFDNQVLVERYIRGTELTVAILEHDELPLIRLETPRVFYDYTAKYESDTTRYICPSGLEPEREQALQRLAGKAFAVLGCSGWGRVDLILDAAGTPYFLEVNTVPGMTDHSLVPMAADHAGIEFDELVLRILATSNGYD